MTDEGVTRRAGQRVEAGAPPRILMVGPPGSGKSSQARQLASRLGIRHLSSGDMLREEVRLGSAIGVRAAAFMRNGELVPDWLIDLLYEQPLIDSTQSGFVLDGFPRTASQAAHLLRRLADHPPNLLIQFLVPDDVVVSRLGRRSDCVQCGAIASDAHASACASCGGTLRRRPDDCDDVVRSRLALYHELLPPLLAVLANIAFRADIDADQCPEVVAEALIRLVDPTLVRPAQVKMISPPAAIS